MAIIAGIDEAGFGPLLGPLVVSGVAFHVPDELAGACLWKVLKQSCTSRVHRHSRRLIIADSKQLYRSGKGLANLERAALVMLATAGRRPTTWRGLLQILAPDAEAQFDAYPWYTHGDLSLPLCEETGDIATRANAVSADAKGHGVRLQGIYSEPLPEGHYNRLVGRTRNKSVVLLGLALRVIDRILRAAPRERVCLFVDRLGGRVHYREALTMALEGFTLRIVEESEHRSAYALERADRHLEIEFLTKGDSRHFAIALASVYSKYVRELCMHAFNDFWCERQPELKPTAGYYQDAKRWLADNAAAIEELAIERDMLVRQR